MSEILVSPERLRTVAGELDSYRDDVDTALGGAITAVNNLQDEWKGMAQVDYVGMFEEQVPSARTTVCNILESLAGALRGIATEFEELDQGIIQR